MPRQRRRAAAVGQQWRRQLRNVPARQAAAAALPPAQIPIPPPSAPLPPAPRPAAAVRTCPIQPRLKRPIRPAGHGQKNNDNVRVRNRRYKIKRILPQPKNVEVKHRGQTVRRMVARRRAIYPTLRQQNEY